MNKITARFALAGITLFLVTLVNTGSTFAQSPTPTGKPGWGFGDNNHIHLGPPGQSVRPEEIHEEMRKMNEKMRQDMETYFAHFREVMNNWFHHHS